MSAVTDSGSGIMLDYENKPGISNLITIYSDMTGVDVEDVKKQFDGFTYSTFKDAVANSIEMNMKPFQEKYKNLRESSKLKEILKSGAEKAKEISNKKLQEVYEKVGFVKI